MHGNRLLVSASAAVAFLAQAVLADHHLIYGAPVPSDNDVPLRLNINDLHAAAGPQWDLYIQALRAMQDMDSSDDLSYFMTAGIHGMPYREWDHAGGQQGSQWLGYCPHGEALFLPWHRPYVLLFEQQLVLHATEIAQKYPDNVRDQYVAAAQTLRAPYWDWAANSQVPPASVPSTIKVNIAGKDGVESADMTNPLQTFRMPQAALNGQYGTFDPYRRSQTVRCPAPYYSYPGSANANLGNRNLKGNVYAAFVYAQNFNQFAMTANNGVGIEQIHNWVHYDASCGQQFWQPDLSGFDPLFMLHHANVDRLWAYWQYIHPDQAIFTNSYYGQSRYATPQGTTITPDSPLEPFFGSQTRMLTTRAVASLNGMGYSYERLQYWNMSGADLTTAARALINETYGNRSLAKKRARTSSQLATNGGWTMQYFARFEIDRTHVERPSTVAIYIDGTKAGDVAVMPQPATGIMKGGFTIDSFVHDAFDKTAESNGTVASIAHLVRVEITKPDGTRIPISSIPSLKVSLEEVPFTPPKSIEDFPVIGKASIHQVTAQEY
ncbi:hypothetical protein NLG97_g624 [Lecanicillium saksenae]|uniref:Uncharacterized protein n=1 Tax=Lecanicillium saksenae TaxID=468837 RepID=A0ACC1R809_9HYPO|nr:hypothetical protein NLG97_g624 [Lecanicillium saksenae]